MFGENSEPKDGKNDSSDSVSRHLSDYEAALPEMPISTKNVKDCECTCKRGHVQKSRIRFVWEHEGIEFFKVFLCLIAASFIHFATEALLHYLK